MKSPLKYPKWLIIFSFLSSCLIFGATLNSYYLSGQEVTFYRVFITVVAILFNTLVGWLLTIRFLSTYLHRKVKNPVLPHKLVAKQTYWLNGQTKAQFVGFLDFTGKCLFHIEGLNKKNDPLDAKALTTDEVMMYISETEEI